MILRQGRKNPHTLYFQVGPEPDSERDISVGYIREAKWARALVEAVNRTGGVVPPRVTVADAEWERAEELRPDRLGPDTQDISPADETISDPLRPGKSLGGVPQY